MRYVYYSAIPEGRSSRLLMVPDGDRWTLPFHETQEHHNWQGVRDEHRLLKEALGMDVFTLRLIWVDYDEDKGRALHLHARTNRSSSLQPPAGALWVDVADLSRTDLGDPDLYAGIRRWHQWRETEPSKKPAPWSSSDWYDPAIAWVDDRLAQLGSFRTGPVSQLTCRARGTGFDVQSDRGRMHFKATSEMFTHEPAVTAALGRWHANKVPTVLAADTVDRWFLAEWIDGTPLVDVSDLSTWQTTLRSYAELQIALARRVEELEALGCPEASLQTFAGEVGRIVEDQLWDVSRDEFGVLLEQIPDIDRMCLDLHDSAIPLSLDHGDLSPWQVILAGRQPYLVDWSDCAITHPFFSLPPFFDDLAWVRDNGPSGTRGMLRDFKAVRESLTQAYLEPWLDVAAMPTLREWMELATQLAPVYQALKFARFLGHGVDSEWDMTGAVPVNLRRLLQGP